MEGSRVVRTQSQNLFATSLPVPSLHDKLTYDRNLQSLPDTPGRILLWEVDRYVLDRSISNSHRVGADVDRALPDSDTRSWLKKRSS